VVIDEPAIWIVRSLNALPVASGTKVQYGRSNNQTLTAIGKFRAPRQRAWNKAIFSKINHAAASNS
jgi:hypothetical protein